MKRVISLLLALVMLVGMGPTFVTRAEATASKITTNLELVDRLIDIAENYKTLYVMGAWGGPLTSSNKTRYINHHSFNRQPERTAMINAASSDTFAFDCVCLIKAVWWGWDGDTSQSNGGAKYETNGMSDISTESIINICSEVSTNFSDIEVGELLWMSGHVGIYIGNGKAVECTPSWKNGVQITDVLNIQSGTGHKWSKHGKLPNIEYLDPHVTESYRSYGKLTVTVNETYVMNMPCSEQTDPMSKNVEATPAKIGDTYTTIGLVRNDTEVGNLWYKVLINGKTTGYIFAGHVSFSQLTDDLYTNNIKAPTNHKLGDSFTIEGTIGAKYQLLARVGAWVDDKNGIFITGENENINQSSYSLKNSYVDKNTKFNEIKEEGTYHYFVAAIAKSYYAESSTKVTLTLSPTIDLHESTFTVSKTCSHSYTSKVTAPTYTAQGYTTYTCSKCGYSYKGNYTDKLLKEFSVSFDPNGGTLPAPTATNTLNGINVDRAVGFLVVYNNSGALVDTNKYGVEVLVDSTGKVTGKRDYLSETKQYVPTGGFVLSGQGENGSWVKEIPIGAYVAYDKAKMQVYVYDTKDAFMANHRYVKEGYAVGTLPVPTKAGYTFDGWYTAKSGGTKVTEDMCIGSDLTFYAHWAATCEINGHRYIGTLEIKPTFSDFGLMWWYCENCNYEFSEVMPALNKTDYICTTIKTPTLTDNGIDQYDWLYSKSGIPIGITVEVEHPCKNGHAYVGYPTEIPTLKTEGAVMWECEQCGDMVSETLPVLRADNYAWCIVFTEPTYSEEGLGCYGWASEYGFCEVYVHWPALKDGCSNGHRFSSEIKYAPALDSEGYLWVYCTSCGYTYEDTLPRLNPTDYEYYVITEPTCTTSGLAGYGLIYGYDIYTFEVDLPALGDEGHIYTYTVTKEPTETTTGTINGTCKRCGKLMTDIMPKLSESNYTYIVEQEPTCTDTGIGKWIWNWTGYGEIAVRVTLNKLNQHEYTYNVTKKPTEFFTGVITGTCTACGSTVPEVMPTLNKTDYRYVVEKEPTHTETGIAKWTWNVNTYGEITIETVLDKLELTLVSVEVKTAPNKTVYQMGEALDTTGLTLLARFSDGSTRTVTDEFTVSGFDSTSAGEKTVTVTHGSKTTSFKVTVEKFAEPDHSTAKIIVDSKKASSGSTVELDVKIADNPGFSVLNIALLYDKQYLTLTEVKNQLPSMTMTSDSTIVWDAVENYNEDGSLCTLKFEIAENTPEGEYEIQVMFISASNDQFEEYNMSGVSGTLEIRNILYGDANGDGKIASVDLAMLRKYLASVDPITGTSSIAIKAGADCNGDGKIASVDLAMLRKYLASVDPITGESSVVLGPR